MKEIQRDIDAGWREYCDSHIAYWRKQVAYSVEDSTVRHAKRELNHFKVLRRMK